jgi:hypothetical protein
MQRKALNRLIGIMLSALSVILLSATVLAQPILISMIEILFGLGAM